MENINILPKVEQKKVSNVEEEKNWKEKVADTIREYTVEDSKLGKMAQVATNQVDKFKKSDRLKWTEGMANMGYKIKETKAEFLSGVYRSMAGATQGNRFLSTFFGKHAELYTEEWNQAEKARKGEKKTISRLSGVGQGAGTLLRYGRMAFDASMVNPFRHVMAASMFVGKQSEALKETRYDYEGAKENTRVNDVERAMEDAWDIYDKAQAESENGIVDVKALEKTYKKNLPKDIEKRFARADYNGLNFIQKGMNRHLGWATKRLTDKIEKIESSDTSPEEKEEEKEVLMNQNQKLLSDLDAMVGDNATVDTIAYLARSAEKTGKTVSTAMMIESIPRLAKLATELGGSFGGSLWARFEPSEAHAGDSGSDNSQEENSKEISLNKEYYSEFQNGTKGMKKTDFFSSKYCRGVDLTKAKDGVYYVINSEDNSIIGHFSEKEGFYTNKDYSAIPVDQENVDKIKTLMDKKAEKNKLNNDQNTISDVENAKEAQVNKGVVVRKNEGVKSIVDIKNAIIGEGDGVEHVFKRQLMAKPEKFGYKGDNNKNAISDWADGEAHRIALNNGYVDVETGHEVRMKGIAVGKAAYILKANENGKTGVTEMTKGDDGNFSSGEIKSGSEEFELDLEDHEEKWEKKETPKLEKAEPVIEKKAELVATELEAEVKPAVELVNLDESNEEMNKTFSKGLFATEKQFGDEWKYLQDMPAELAMNTNVSVWSNKDAFADYLEKHQESGQRFIGNQLDMVELNNREKMQKLLSEAQKKIDRPEDGETIEEYLIRYYQKGAEVNADKHFQAAERIFTEEGIEMNDGEYVNFGDINTDHNLSMIGVDRDGNGLIDSFALVETGKGIEDVYEFSTVKADDDFNSFKERTMEEFKNIVDNRLEKLDGLNIAPEQAQEIGIKIFDKDGINNLEEAQLKFAASFRDFDAKKIKDVFGIVERHNFDLSDGKAESVYKNINNVLGLSENSDFNPNQREAIKEMFFSDPKQGVESEVVLKRLFGEDDYNKLGISNPDISPGSKGASVLNLGKYKIIIETNGNAHVSESREILKEWEHFNSDAVKDVKEMLQGKKEYTMEDIKSSAAETVNRLE
ncbi:MAG: hypothetical protein U9Q85_01415 [Patescibacteria group bacterium]|nr:hypothetical protein [Patescibacteria group bacterium]